jgi:F-type H+-transporting ATPase subunit gamma
MATVREIRRRIIAVKSTKKITRAMQMVAAAKLRRAQENILKIRPYANQLEETISQVAMRTKRDLHPLLREKKAELKNLLVVVTADSGLCGGFNANIIKGALNYIEGHNFCKNIDIYAIGRKGRDYFRKNYFTIVGEKVMFFNRLKYSDPAEVVKDITTIYLKGDYDRVDILYNEFKSAIQQAIRVKQFLPLVPAEAPSGITPVDFIYEPGEMAVFDTLIPYHLEVQMWRVMLESYAAEMGAKMTAMDAATENADDLLNVLSITYNRARQAQITREISEIVGGAESLKA